MNKKRLNTLLNELSQIATTKSLFPLSLQRWLSELGLYVRLHDDWPRTTLQAGGLYRAYLVARRDEGNLEERNWEVTKFDEDTWNRRFAHLVKPTADIAGFMFTSLRTMQIPEAEVVATLASVIGHYKATGKWLGFHSFIRSRQSRADRQARKMAGQFLECATEAAGKADEAVMGLIPKAKGTVSRAEWAEQLPAVWKRWWVVFLEDYGSRMANRFWSFMSSVESKSELEGAWETFETVMAGQLKSVVTSRVVDMQQVFAKFVNRPELNSEQRLALEKWGGEVCEALRGEAMKYTEVFQTVNREAALETIRRFGH